MTVASISSPGANYPIGSLIAEKYQVERVLGAGGMGAVLEVKHMILGHYVALKVLHPGSAHLDGAVPRFLREARATAALESEHVVRIFDLGTTSDGSPFLVMERLTGLDLDEVLGQVGPLPVGFAVECLYQAALGVQVAHAAGIIHRDLKPSNLFLTKTAHGQPLLKVLDFGISKLQDETQDVSLTETRSIVGSPQYMSPEQVRDSRAASVRSDIWALGAILHELLDARPPFTGNTLPSISASIVSDEPAELRSPGVPEGVHQIRLRCLKKDPAERYGSVNELLRDIEAARQLAPVGDFFNTIVKFPQPSSRGSAPSPRKFEDPAFYALQTVSDSGATIGESGEVAAPSLNASGVRNIAVSPTLNSAPSIQEARAEGRMRWLLLAATLVVVTITAVLAWPRAKNSVAPESEASDLRPSSQAANKEPSVTAIEKSVADVPAAPLEVPVQERAQAVASPGQADPAPANSAARVPAKKAPQAPKNAPKTPETQPASDIRMSR